MIKRIAGSSVWKLLHRLGVAPYLSAIYWAVRLERDPTMVQTIDGYEARFVLQDRRDYHRIRTLMGEGAVIRRLLGELSKDDVYLDIGGNIGTHACFAAQKIDEGSVVVFDPSPNYTDRLAENLTTNTDDGTVFQVALSDSDGFTCVDMSGRGGDSIGNKGDIVVAQTRIASLIRDEEIAVPDVVKIDVEGAELRVVRGFKEYLADVRTFICEVHPEKMESFGDKPEQLEHLFQEKGFRVTEIASRADTYHVIASRGPHQR